MKIKGCGQARVLEQEEHEKLFSHGFTCARDRALFGINFYGAARISESLKILIKDVFDPDALWNDKKIIIRDSLMLRKRNTKGEIGTREIKIHPRLEAFLKQYVKDSWRLIEIRKIVGNWTLTDLSSTQCIDQNPEIYGRISCPRCQSQNLKKDDSTSSRKQAYKCKTCNSYFQETLALSSYPDLRDEIISLGVKNSFTYSFLLSNPQNPYLFPGFLGSGHLSRATAHSKFVDACERTGIDGASTHSGRRGVLTRMSRAGVPLRTIQSISGHQSLGMLRKYIEVDPKEVQDAINCLPNLFVE